MGFFSAKCMDCQHPLLSIYATNPVNDWMQHAVVITPNGSVLKGVYDGYGRVDDFDYAVGGEPNTVWHLAAHAEDQGYFFDDGAHDMEEPK